MTEFDSPTSKILQSLSQEADDLFLRTLEQGLAIGDCELVDKRLGDLIVRFVRTEMHPSRTAAQVESLTLGAPSTDLGEIIIAGEYITCSDHWLGLRAETIGSIVITELFRAEEVPPGPLTRHDYAFVNAATIPQTRYTVRAGFAREPRHVPHEHIDANRRFIEKCLTHITDEETFLGMNDAHYKMVQGSVSFEFNPTSRLRFNGTENPLVIRQYIAIMRERREDLYVLARRALNIDPTGEAYGVYRVRLQEVYEAISAAKSCLGIEDDHDELRI